MASSSIDEMVRWGAANGVSFDPKKTEVMHFSCSKFRTAPAVRHGDVEKHPEAALRWLGIWLDSRLSFWIHVEKWTAKAKAVAYHIARIDQHDIRPSTECCAKCRQGLRRAGSTSRIRGVVLGRRPPPPYIEKVGYHQLTNCLMQGDLDSPPDSSRLTRLTFWRVERDRPANLLTTTSSNEDIKHRRKAASEHVFDVQMSSLRRARDRNSSSDASIKSFCLRFRWRQKSRLGPAEVFDAEATGALEGLKAALNLRELATQNIYICLDNLAAATCLRGTPSDSSQDVFFEFQALATSHGPIQVCWVPGHSDIPGNEQADKLAKAASSLPEPEGAKLTLAYLRRIARQKPKEAFEAWWSASAPEQYRRLNLKATTGCPPELWLPRVALHHLLAARSLHGDFAIYHEKFDHVNTRLVCSCGRRKAPDHIFYCREVPPRCRMRLTPSPNTAVNLAIGKDFTKFIDLSKDSAFFGKICPRH
ncbi:hypothetical protein BFJ70_g16779 [Fusarium oxysporum]|nr:hypothetical protein BFJ70_g16779 [Fusarium oxysporum]